MTAVKGETLSLDPTVPFAVYVLRDVTGRVLYVGKSANWLARVGSHATNPEIRERLASVTIIECESAAGMADKEIELIGKLQPMLNQQGNPGYAGRCPTCSSLRISATGVNREVAVKGRIRMAHGMGCDACGESWGSTRERARRAAKAALP